MFLVIMTHMLYNYFCLFKNFYFLPFRQPTRVLLPGKSHGRRSLLRCSPRGRWGSDMTERLHFHFSLSCIGEGNGNPLQYSCLENPRDGGAYWAAVYGVAQSRTRLKRLSSSSSKLHKELHSRDSGCVNFTFILYMSFFTYPFWLDNEKLHSFQKKGGRLNITFAHFTEVLLKKNCCLCSFLLGGACTAKLRIFSSFFWYPETENKGAKQTLSSLLALPVKSDVHPQPSGPSSLYRTILPALCNISPNFIL